MSPLWTNDRLRKSPDRVLHQLHRESWRLVLVEGFNPLEGSSSHPLRSVGRPPRMQASCRIESLRRLKAGIILDPNGSATVDRLPM